MFYHCIQANRSVSGLQFLQILAQPFYIHAIRYLDQNFGNQGSDYSESNRFEDNDPNGAASGVLQRLVLDLAQCRRFYQQKWIMYGS
jgi:hypothetical protein